MNIFSNFIPNKYVTFGDRDQPWINDFVKTKIRFKNQLYNTYIKSGCNGNDCNMLHEAIMKVLQLLATGKKSIITT